MNKHVISKLEIMSLSTVKMSDMLTR